MRQQICLSVIGGIIVGLVYAATAVASHDQVVTMLSIIEDLPDAATWRQLRENPVPSLIQIANDPNEKGFRRVRAITVLGYFTTDPNAIETIEYYAEHGADSPSMQRSAVLAISNASPEKSLPTLENALAHRDPLMRQVAIKGLERVDDPRAREILRSRLSHEETEFVRSNIQRALERKP